MKRFLTKPEYFGFWNAVYVVPLSLALNVFVGAALANTISNCRSLVMLGISAFLYVVSTLAFLLVAARQQILWEVAQKDTAESIDSTPYVAARKKLEEYASSYVNRRQLLGYFIAGVSCFLLATALTVAVGVDCRAKVGTACDDAEKKVQVGGELQRAERSNGEKRATPF